jgi:hypothetical protein
MVTQPDNEVPVYLTLPQIRELLIAARRGNDLAIPSILGTAMARLQNAQIAAEQEDHNPFICNCHSCRSVIRR